MRKPIIAGNWKMNKTVAEAKAFVEAVKDKIPAADKVDAVVAGPTLTLSAIVEVAKGSDLQSAAQNCYFENSGAFTGEIGRKPLLKIALVMACVQSFAVVKV